jgi:hypothetical protein
MSTLLYQHRLRQLTQFQHANTENYSSYTTAHCFAAIIAYTILCATTTATAVTATAVQTCAYNGVDRWC